jgi:hypothetical protein
MLVAAVIDLVEFLHTGPDRVFRAICVVTAIQASDDLFEFLFAGVSEEEAVRGEVVEQGFQCRDET